MVEWVMSAYDESQWLTELEAFAGANASLQRTGRTVFETCTLNS